MSEIAVTPLLKSRRTWELVDSKKTLEDAISQLETYSGAFAVDAERASGFKYSARAYLIQIARTEGPIFLIDPVGVSPTSDPNDFVKLRSVLGSAPWILHAATQDLPCLAELGLQPTGIIDTELGSRLAGLPRVGLGAVVEHYLGLQLAKEHSAVDWSTRPLSDSWLEYAALDVDVLHELSHLLLQDLQSQGKTEMAGQEFDHLVGFKPKGEKPDRWRGLSGLHEVKDQKGLAIARSLWQAREELAKRMDVSPGRLIPDTSVTHVAKQQHKTRPELAADRLFAGRASRTYLDTWWDAIESGRNSTDLPPLRIAHVGIPNHRSWPAKFPEANKRLHLAKTVIAAKQEELNVPAENLLTPDFLRQICFIDRTTATATEIHSEMVKLGARTWQADLLAVELADAITSAKYYELNVATEG